MRDQSEVSITLLLSGGHSKTLFLNSKDPFLGALFSSMSEKTQTSRAPRLFNIRVDDGRHSLLFSSADLVGLLIDPPIAPERGDQMRPTPAASDDGMVKSPYALIENFVEPAVHRELLDFVVAQARDFVPSSVSTNDADYRHSLVLHNFPKFAAMFRERVRSLVPRLIKAFAMEEFAVGDVECQLTAHNDGDYFHVHNDNGSTDTHERTISYVFYFHNTPKAFSGGEFRLYHSRIINGCYERADFAADIDPKDNSILFFPSHCHHEVLPVRCASQSFADSRFTINGWVRRRKAIAA